MAPSILLVPGWWEGPTVFNEVKDHLQKTGFSTHTAQLASTGHISPGNPGLQDDIASVRKSIEEAVGDDREVVLVLHSVGGIIGGMAMEGFEASKRKEQGKTGGIIKIVFLAAGIGPEGHPHELPPFAEIKDRAIYCKDIEHALFADVPDTDNWLAVMQPQPEDWAGSVTYCGWRNVPSTYVVTEQDNLIPTAIQEQLAGMAGSKVRRLQAGHMMMLSKPEDVSMIIAEEAWPQ